jgi:diacylglycerol kinase (ATP)
VKTLVVINPHSGGGKGLVVGAKVRANYAGLGESITYIQASSLKESLAQVQSACANSKFDLLISVGGDGLIHDLLPSLIENDLPLLVIPAGTGNDFARTLGLHGQKLALLLAQPALSKPSLIDVGLIKNGLAQTPFIQILSTGFDSVVNERANNFKIVRGKIKYILAVLQKVWRFRALEFTLDIDGQERHQKAMLVCVANGQSYGGGMKIVPHAKDDDGLLDVMVVDRVNPFRLLMVFPRVFFGTHVTHPKVHFYTGRSIKISGKTQAFADGERISDLPIEVKISEKSLRVYRL